MIDTVQVIREWLEVSGTGLYALCGTRLHCPMLPPEYKNEAAAIMFHPEIETSHITATDVHQTIFVFRCFGGSSSYTTARSVYRALHDRLHGIANEATASGTIIQAELITAFQGGADPDTGWPSHVAKFWVRMH